MFMCGKGVHLINSIIEFGYSLTQFQKLVQEIRPSCRIKITLNKSFHHIRPYTSNIHFINEYINYEVWTKKSGIKDILTDRTLKSKEPNYELPGCFG
jgi:hypothetical protein